MGDDEAAAADRIPAITRRDGRASCAGNAGGKPKGLLRSETLAPCDNGASYVIRNGDYKPSSGQGRRRRKPNSGHEGEKRSAAVRTTLGLREGKREREERSMFLWRFVNRLLRAPPIAGDTPGLNTCFPPFLPTHRLHSLSLHRPSTLPTTPFPHHRTSVPSCHL